MKGWGIALAAGALLVVGSQCRAQTPVTLPNGLPSGVPTGGNGLTFVPINTANLSTPLPYTVSQSQPTFRDHVHHFFHDHLPRFLRPIAALPGPLAPIAQLANIPQLKPGQTLSPTITVPFVPNIGANIK